MNIIRDVEIFASGTHNGDKYPTEDLDEIVSAYAALDYVPPIKAGHAEKPGAPALGWVKNLRRVGSKLVADFTDLPQVVYDAIREKRYNAVSSEIFWNLKRNGKEFRRALKAVALLGAEIPAVAELRPLHEMFSGFDAEVRHADFSLSDVDGDRKPNQPTEKDEMDLKELQEQVKKLSEAQVASDARVAEAEKRAKEAEDREKAAAKRLDEIAANARKHEIAGITEKCVIPALRPLLAAYCHLADRAGDVKVYDAEQKEQTPSALLTKAIEDINTAASKKLFSVVSDGKPAPRDVDPDKPVGDVVDELVRKDMAANKRNYSESLSAVLDADPELKARYAAA